ncbi:unnamed protein product [Arabis nemorensis]|uniref:DUF4283 domain-containing protein n=1 Tax=Arabis nemorensis TaxID=586526 RepID=A0A565C438_9BRAS|nr:unnamed protein product [Arabis nemorensis]
MTDNLHAALGSMSLEDDEPITLPDSPRFRVLEANKISLLGHLLNAEYQSMAKMIEYMPTAWTVYDKVLGIALSRDRFQLTFNVRKIS